MKTSFIRKGLTHPYQDNDSNKIPVESVIETVVASCAFPLVSDQLIPTPGSSGLIRENTTSVRRFT
ncbi:hypothetical protein [Kaarinaea lacus]